MRFHYPLHVPRRTGALLLALVLAGCATGPRNPLHVSFEELGYAGEDFGSLFGSVKYRSVVNIAGLAPISSVGGLHNRPAVFSQLNPQRLFRDESLPDYYSLGITMECSKIFELLFDDGVTQQDVWRVREDLQKFVGDARKAIARLARKNTATSLAGAYRQAAQAVQALDGSKFNASAPPAEVEREQLLRSLLVDVLADGAGDLSTLGLPPADIGKLEEGPTAAGFTAWQAAVQNASRAFALKAATLSALDPAAIEEAISKVSHLTGDALRKGIIVTRWYADSNRSSSGRLGTVVSRDSSESRGRQGFLVMGGIRLSQLMVGDDFITYHQKVSNGVTGADGAVKEQFLVLYTVGAKYRSFFEESAAESASSLQAALTPEQLSSLLAFPLRQSLGGALDIIRSQSLRYERQLRAATEAAEQGFLPSPRVNVYEFRFNADKLFEHSMMEEKARSAMYLPVYSVRADVVQKDTKLLIGSRGGSRSRCAQTNDDDAADKFSWKSGTLTLPAEAPVFRKGYWERPRTAKERADHVQFHTPILTVEPPVAPAGGR